MHRNYENRTLVINWHILEQCNYGCTYCFSHWDELTHRNRSEALAEVILNEIGGLAGRDFETSSGNHRFERIRLNFAGGEPFLAKNLGNLISQAHALGLAPSFISNGTLIKDDFINWHAQEISVAGFSFDAAEQDVMQRIGRVDSRRNTLSLDRLERLCAAFRRRNSKISIKINTVVCTENAHCDLRPALDRIKPDRWKILRVLPGNGVRPIPDELFEAFIKRHADVAMRVVEDNDLMRGSYLMIDPAGRLYQNTRAEGYAYSEPIQDVGIVQALSEIPFLEDRFHRRYEAAL